MKLKLLAILLLPTIVTFNVFSSTAIVPIIKPVIAENVSKFKTFNLPNEFSVSYPARWFIQHTTNPPNTTPRELVIITNLKPSKIGSGELPPNLIKTDIQINPESLETSIQKVIQSRNDNQDEKITKFGKIFIGGKEAFRAWISGIEGKSILTLVRHGNKETVSIISFYSEQNPAAIPIIQRLHNSFRSYR